MTLGLPAWATFPVVVSDHFENLNKLFPLTVFKGWELIFNTLCLKGLGLCAIGYVFVRQQALCPVQKCMDVHFLHTSTGTSQVFALPLQRNQDVAGMCVFEMPACTEQRRVLSTNIHGRLSHSWKSPLETQAWRTSAQVPFGGPLLCSLDRAAPLLPVG